jgi:hypothetical protein
MIWPRLHRTLEETIARVEALIAADGIARTVVRDMRGDYWILRGEGSVLLDHLEGPTVTVWTPKRVEREDTSCE